MLKFGQIIIILFAFIWVVIASNQAAKFFQKIQLPLITGFLLSGILIGPFGLKLIDVEMTYKLDFVNDISLSFIALLAGSELFLKEIRNNIKSILWNTLSQLILTFTLVSVGVYFLEGYISFMKDLPELHKVAIAILSGTIFIAKSPSSVMAVINELRAKGRFTKMVISVTVLLDVLVIVLFTICLTIANNLINNTPFSFKFLYGLILEFVVIFIVAILFAKFLEFLMQVPLPKFIKIFLILISGFGVFKLSHILELISFTYLGAELIIEPLLICIIASFYITNYSRQRDSFHIILKDIAPMVYAGFFTLVGATLALDVLANTWLIALIILIFYFSSLIIASLSGNLGARNPKLYGKIGWMPFITQAGVGFALVYEVAQEFPEWGNQFSTILIAVIVINQIVGPPLFKWAIKLVGESHLPVSSQNLFNKTAIIFGLEHQSLNLARDLFKENYSVEIVSLEKRRNISDIKDITIHVLDGLSVKALNSIGIRRFETIVLMLSDDENFKVCRLINENIGAKTIIVRLYDSINADKFHELGALVVDPSTAISKLIEQFVRSPLSASFILGEEDHKAMVDIKVRDKNLHGIALRDLRLPPDVLILSVKRKGQMLISHGYTRLRRGDIVTIVGSMESLQDLSLQFEE
ncbi:MAG TPA: potassium transporter TrkA [Bacteroidales bacterium]|nr:potassium transporter TrkA [Bacteroidales bacterium]